MEVVTSMPTTSKQVSINEKLIMFLFPEFICTIYIKLKLRLTRQLAEKKKQSEHNTKRRIYVKEFLTFLVENEIKNTDKI